MNAPMGSPTMSQFANRSDVTLNVTLPTQAANCLSDDEGLGGDGWRGCSPK